MGTIRIVVSDPPSVNDWRQVTKSILRECTKYFHGMRMELSASIVSCTGGKISFHVWGAPAYFHFHPFKIYRTILGFRACKTCSASAQPRQGLADQLRKSRATAHKPCFRPCTSRLSLRIPISGFGRFPQRFTYLIGNKSIPAVMGGKQGEEGRKNLWRATCGPRFSSGSLEAETNLRS